MKRKGPVWLVLRNEAVWGVWASRADARAWLRDRRLLFGVDAWKVEARRYRIKPWHVGRYDGRGGAK